MTQNRPASCDGQLATEVRPSHHRQGLYRRRSDYNNLMIFETSIGQAVEENRQVNHVVSLEVRTGKSFPPFFKPTTVYAYSSSLIP